MAHSDKQAERVHMQNELALFKTEINLFNLAQEHYGFEVDFKKSTKKNVREASNISMSNGIDRMILSEKSTWLYWDTSEQTGVNNKIGGDVINFIQWQESGCNLGQVRKILRSYLSNNKPQNTAKKTQYEKAAKEDTSQSSDKNIPLVIKTLNKLKPATQSDYLETRGITAETLNTPLFRNRVLHGYNKALIFPHWNEGGLCGFEFKTIDFAGFSKHGYKGLWYSQIPKNLTQLIFVESSLEALSHYQKRRPSGAAYFTASGSWTPETGTLIGKVLSKYPDTQIVAAFNNDKGGKKQAEKLTAIAQTVGRSSSLIVSPPKEVGSDWNDSLEKPRPTIGNGRTLGSQS